MSEYGRNFEFRVSPQPNYRSGRYKNSTVAIPIGVPVAVADGATRDANGRLTFALATGAQAPEIGQCGIAVYEYAWEAFEGRDPNLTTSSDLDTVPANEPCQLVNGTDVVVVLRNTVAGLQLGRSYPGRIMTAGVSLATPTVVVGDLLTPGVGNDTDGYWAETGTAANGWLRVIGVDTTRAEVTARMLF